MARKKRDYKAEYARRNALAQKRGFKSYNAQRKAIEKGRFPAIAPGRIRSRKTLDAQTNYSIVKVFGRSELDIRIEASLAWSERNARTETMKFDEARARKEPDYERTYFSATVMQFGATELDESTLVNSPELQHLLVDLMDIYEPEEYDEKYKNKD